MILDSWLIWRHARELEALLGGARLQSVHSSEREFALAFYRRGVTYTLQVVLDQTAPVVTVAEKAERQKQKSSGGWAGSVAALLRGCTVDAIHAVPSDRVMFVDLSSRSAFDLPSLTRLVLELQPRKANVLILRRSKDETWITVAAAKQFGVPSGSPRSTAQVAAQRSVRVGEPYVLPPARKARVNRAQFVVMCDRVAADDVSSLGRLLGDYDPACTPSLAREVVHRALAMTAHEPTSGSAIKPTSHAGLSRRLLSIWQELHAEVAAAQERGEPLYAYVRDKKLVACHLIPLRWPGVEPDRVAQVNDVCRAALVQREIGSDEPNLDAIKKRLATMLSRGRTESATLQQALAQANAADELRKAGELIYANLASIPPGAKDYAAEGTRVQLEPLLSAKQNAAQYFKRYRKARSGMPQIKARLQALGANRAYWEQLEWELDRIQEMAPSQRPAALVEIEAAIGLKVPKSAKRVSARAASVRAGNRTVRLSGGAIAYVGSSPKDNERLTFMLAAPGDFWFHARGIPGAHVIVKTEGNSISEEQIAEAAALAAGQSRAAASSSVDVDYTQRKHVRRQAAGRHGMVWYDNFRTIRVKPKSISNNT